MNHCEPFEPPLSTTLHGIGKDGEDAQHIPGPVPLRPTMKPWDIGLPSAWHRAQDRNTWSILVLLVMMVEVKWRP